MKKNLYLVVFELIAKSKFLLKIITFYYKINLLQKYLFLKNLFCTIKSMFVKERGFGSEASEFSHSLQGCNCKIYFCSCVIFIFSFCNTLEKERLELDKQILEFEKERFQKCGCSCECNQKIILSNSIPIEVEKKETCTKISPPSPEEIWKLAEKGDWSYSPKLLSQKEICKEFPKEAFYKIYKNTDSYVAETQVPKTKKSSCINNVLFHGKDNLYDSMIEQAANEKGVNYIKEKFIDLKNKVIEYNTQERGRSFYYECRPTDEQLTWNKCICVLYASFEGGKEKLKEKIK